MSGVDGARLLAFWASGLLGFGGGVVSGLACFATRHPFHLALAPDSWLGREPQQAWVGPCWLG